MWRKYLDDLHFKIDEKLLKIGHFKDNAVDEGFVAKPRDFEQGWGWRSPRWYSWCLEMMPFDIGMGPSLCCTKPDCKKYAWVAQYHKSGLWEQGAQYLGFTFFCWRGFQDFSSFMEKKIQCLKKCNLFIKKCRTEKNWQFDKKMTTFFLVSGKKIGPKEEVFAVKFSSRNRKIVGWKMRGKTLLRG